MSAALQGLPPAQGVIQDVRRFLQEVSLRTRQRLSKFTQSVKVPKMQNLSFAFDSSSAEGQGGSSGAVTRSHCGIEPPIQP